MSFTLLSLGQNSSSFATLYGEKGAKRPPPSFSARNRYIVILFILGNGVELLWQRLLETTTYSLCCSSL